MAAGLAIDNDPEATECSQENFERNHVSNVAIVTGTLDKTENTFDLILANIQADVLCDLAPAMAAKLANEGHVILSGILSDSNRRRGGRLRERRFCPGLAPR